MKTFWEFLNERHRIYLKKEAGKPWPWTDDQILQRYKFTNVYRQLDRVTKYYTHRIGDPELRFSPTVRIFNTIAFRMFNVPETFDALLKICVARWDEMAAKRVLHDRASQGVKVFTGAYIITNAGSKRPKIDLVCEAVTWAWERRVSLTEMIVGDQTLENAHRALQQIPLVGGFVAYELASDLRWNVLSDALDILTWAHAGPGAVRGLNRLHGRPVKAGMGQKAALAGMRDLLAQSQRRGVLGKHMPPLEMREIEHSLCEYDKYARVALGEGRPRSKYIPF
jgi:hypothetical protein